MKKVELAEAQKAQLREIIQKGRHSVGKVRRARILLYLSEGETIEETAARVEVCMATVSNVKKRFFDTGQDPVSSLLDKPRPGQPPKLTPELEAHITALACSAAPDGRSQWSLRLIRDKAVELEYVGELSHESVRRVLKKASLSPGLKSSGAFRK